MSPPWYLCWLPKKRAPRKLKPLGHRVFYPASSCILSATFTVQSHTWLSGDSLCTYRCRQQRQVGKKQHTQTPMYTWASLPDLILLPCKTLSYSSKSDIPNMRLNWRKAMIYVCLCVRVGERKWSWHQPYIHIFWSNPLVPCEPDQTFWRMFWSPGSRKIIGLFYSSIQNQCVMLWK